MLINFNSLARNFYSIYILFTTERQTRLWPVHKMLNSHPSVASPVKQLKISTRLQRVMNTEMNFYPNYTKSEWERRFIEKNEDEQEKYL